MVEQADNHLKQHNNGSVCFSMCSSDVSHLSKVCFKEGLNEGVSGMLTTVDQGHLLS